LPEIRFGEKEVRHLCQRFNLDPREAVEGMRDFVTDKPAQIPDGLKKLHACLKTLPCSTAECERGFSLMNIISTDLRFALLVKNLSSLMLVNLDGPPLRLWHPGPYVIRPACDCTGLPTRLSQRRGGAKMEMSPLVNSVFGHYFHDDV